MMIQKRILIVLISIVLFETQSIYAQQDLNSLSIASLTPEQAVQILHDIGKKDEHYFKNRKPKDSIFQAHRDLIIQILKYHYNVFAGTSIKNCHISTSVQRAMRHAAYEYGCTEIVENYLNDMLNANCKRDLKFINNDFLNAVKRGYIDLMKMLVDIPNNKPDQAGVNMAFAEAAMQGNLVVMEWLATKPNGMELPNQKGVNMAFASAAEAGRLGIMKVLSNKFKELPCPNQRGFKVASVHVNQPWFIAPKEKTVILEFLEGNMPNDEAKV